MTPADQTTFGVDRYPYAPGDCLSACVATLLDVKVSDVPIFLDERDPYDGIWLERLDRWLADHHGLHVSQIEIDVSSPEELSLFAPDFPYVLCGTSIRGRDHAVVAIGGEVVHDPHPSRTGLVRGLRMIVLG